MLESQSNPQPNYTEKADECRISTETLRDKATAPLVQ